MAPKQKHHSANQKGKATQRGDSNPFVIARRQKVAQLYSFHHLSAADIYRLFKTDPKLRPYWTQDEEGNPLRPPSKSTIEADVRKLKEKFREERLETYTYLTNLTQFRLERLFARAVEKEDFGLRGDRRGLANSSRGFWDPSWRKSVLGNEPLVSSGQTGIRLQRFCGGLFTLV